MKHYVDYIVDTTCRLLAIDSPTGYTKNAAEFVMEEYRKLGYDPKMTVKGCVLVDIGGQNRDNGILLAAHADTLGAMVSEIKANGNLKVSPLGGMNPNNAEAENVRVYTRGGAVIEGTCQLNNASIHVNADYDAAKRQYGDMEVVLDEMVNSKQDTQNLGILVGVIGPSPPLPSLASIILPCLCAVIVIPPSMWQTMRFISLYFLPTLLAYL